MDGSPTPFYQSCTVKDDSTIASSALQSPDEVFGGTPRGGRSVRGLVGTYPPGSYSALGSATDDDPVPPANTPDKGPVVRQLIAMVLIQGFHVMTRGSYVVTLVLMMAWSITYHSWLTFVLLLWSCVLWMMPRLNEMDNPRSRDETLLANMFLFRTAGIGKYGDK